MTKRLPNEVEGTEGKPSIGGPNQPKSPLGEKESEKLAKQAAKPRKQPKKS